MNYNATAKSALNPIHRVGRITKLYGEQGGVSVKLKGGNVVFEKNELELNAKNFAQIIKTEPLWIEIESIATPFFVTSAKPQGASAVAVTLDYIDTEQKAEMLIGTQIFVRGIECQRERASDWDDLAGLKFTDQTSGKTGVVMEVIENSLNPLLFVEIEGEEHYVPLAKDLIMEINHELVVYQLPENFF